MATTDHQRRGQRVMEEQGGTRPRVTFFQPPQSRRFEGPCPGNWDLDLDSVLPVSTGHVQLLLEEKVKQFEETKKKTKILHKQLQQQFLKDQERKTEWKKKAEEQFKKSLEVFDRRSGKVPARPSAVAEAKPKKSAAAADSKKTKRRV